MCQAVLRGPEGLGDEPEPQRRKKLRAAMLVEGITVAIWFAVAFLIYMVAARVMGNLSPWFILPPLREACKGTSNVINYAVELLM
ncbi:hypothetical protein PLESTB_001499800 [Pleodorina starrii]|uniref:Uncharacterized protein n=1 Tax=Pleodorina starrii TaxID=330485 RepID=A0A9W6BW74_9CHLO|nr:hypothetical protein PLESTB_001499800 [Pleodorina starrii]GLC67794.1 hypothetical protein PLESTF_000608100 [Pleodorina starrii]